MTREQETILSLAKPYIKKNIWIASYRGVILSTDWYMSRLAIVYPTQAYPAIQYQIACNYSEAQKDNWENRPEILWAMSQLYDHYSINPGIELLSIEDLMDEEESRFKEFQFRKVRYGAGKLIVQDPMTGRKFLSVHFAGMVSCKKADKISLKIYSPEDGTESLVWKFMVEDGKTHIKSETIFREHNFRQYVGVGN